jgi:hypothetical protein
MSDVTYRVRPLGPGDQRLAWDLGSLAFGYHERPMPEDWTSDSPGRRTLGVFDPAGRRLVLTQLLQGARQRGAVISTLFNTTPAPYRALGWGGGRRARLLHGLVVLCQVRGRHRTLAGRAGAGQ